MDEVEKRVLRWRKPSMSERLKVTETLLDDLKENSLITQDMAKQIQVQTL